MNERNKMEGLTEPQKNHSINQRLTTLRKISGLKVSHYRKNGVNYFVFGPENHNLKSVCTYRKAKVFAEGIGIGRKLPLVGNKERSNESS